MQQTIAPVRYIQIPSAEQRGVFAKGVPIETVLIDGDPELDCAATRSLKLMAAVA